MESAFELLAEERFTSVTVQDILDRAQCSRSSFYKYFNDKYELMRLYYTSFVDELLFIRYDGKNYPDIQAQIFQFLIDRESYFRNVKDLEGPDSFWSFLARYAFAFFSSVKCLNEGSSAISERDRLELLFIVNGAVSVFRDFAVGDSAKLSPPIVSDLLCRHYPSEYYELPEGKVERFRERFSEAVKTAVAP